MPKSSKARLIAAAIAARKRAVAPYSRFKVGAALLTADGQIITGANVESASFGLTCCAERIALFKALSEGHRKFVAIAMVASGPDVKSPCGACRQLLAEYAPAAVVWSADPRRPRQVRERTVAQLLPEPFLAFSTEDDPAL